MRGEEVGAPFFFPRRCAGYEAASLQEHGARGLFDVEIGQFESVSFNFSQLYKREREGGVGWGCGHSPTPPLSPLRLPLLPLIGYKLVFSSWSLLLLSHEHISRLLHSGSSSQNEHSATFPPSCLSNTQSSA